MYRSCSDYSRVSIHFQGIGLQFTVSFSFLPAAPAARAAASGPASGTSSWGGGRSRGSGLASSLLLAASPPTLLASRVCVAALIGRQLARQPERGRYRPGRRRQRGLHRFGRRGGVDLTGITDSSLALLLAGSAVSPPMTGHHLHGGDSGGVGGEVHPVACPDAGPVNGGQFL
jgi:hypothetical protein